MRSVLENLTINEKNLKPLQRQTIIRPLQQGGVVGDFGARVTFEALTGPVVFSFVFK